jgi:O-antigen/teichoic acid export membrane protein
MKSVLQVFSFDVVSKALLGVTGIILIHYMKETEYARYTLAVSLVTVVTQAFTTSFNRLYIVGYKRLKLEDSSSSFLGFQLAGILALVLLTFPFRGFARGVYWFAAAATLATCFSEFSKTFFQEKMKFIRFSMIELSRTLLITVGVILLILSLGSRLAAFQVLLIQTLAMGLIFIIAFGNKLSFSKLFQFKKVLSLASTIIKGQYRFLFGYFFLFSIFGQIDIFMLRSLANDTTLATYGSAFRYYTLIIMALGSVHAVLLPATQRAENMAQLKNTFSKYMKLVFAFAPLVLAGAWASQWIIPAIDSGKYPQAITVFRILAVSSIISFAFSPHVNLVMKFEKFKFLFLLVSSAIGISIGLNALLIPRFGAIGTAISTFISFAYVNGSTYVCSRRILNSNVHFRSQDIFIANPDTSEEEQAAAPSGKTLEPVR